MRITNIRRAVLEILERAQPYALPEDQLLIEVNARIRPPAGRAELDEQLLFLQVRGFINTIPDRLDETLIKWAITEAGQTMLMQR